MENKVVFQFFKLDQLSLKISKGIPYQIQFNKLHLLVTPWYSCRHLIKFIKLSKIEDIILIKLSRIALLLRKWLTKV